MNLSLLVDPLFRIPFANGLILALLLPAVGAYVRLREEWLASLGLAQAAAGGAMVGVLLFEPGALVALIAAAVAAGVKALLGRGGNDSYAVMILFGWTAALLVAANTAHGEELTRALTQGQLYFTGVSDLIGAGLLLAATLALLPWLSRRLLLGRFFPDHFRANGVARPHHDFLFDLLLAVTLALAATIVGVMASFALVFVPPWIVFRFAHGWRRAVLYSSALAVAAYVVSFALAILFDQPFGPVLVGVLLVAATARLVR